MVEQQYYETSGSSGASPGESPYLNRITWASYKGLSRGQLGGIVLGGLIGLGVGIATAGLLMPFSASIASSIGIGVTGLTTAIVGGFTAIGAKYYYDVFKQVGATSGAMAAGMEISEERSQVMNIKLDTILNVLAKDGKISAEEIKTIEDDVEAVYRQGTHNFEKKFIDKPAYFWQIGTVGAVAGAAVVAALGGGAYLMELIVHGADAASHMVDAVNPALGAVALGGGALAGATYGINRNYYRHVFNVTNALFEGNLAEIEKQRARQHGLMPEVELPDFTPVAKKENAHSASATPDTTVTQPSASKAMPRKILADMAQQQTSTWEELQRARTEAASLTDQQPTIH